MLFLDDGLLCPEVVPTFDALAVNEREPRDWRKGAVVKSASLTVDAALCYAGLHWSSLGRETAVLFRLAGPAGFPVALWLVSLDYRLLGNWNPRCDGSETVKTNFTWASQNKGENPSSEREMQARESSRTRPKKCLTWLMTLARLGWVPVIQSKASFDPGT